MNRIDRLDNLKIIIKDNKKICIKKTNKNSQDIYNYLKSKDFKNILDTKYINNNEIREYIDEINITNEDKLSELIYLICDLHIKTTHYKNITLDSIKEEYESTTNEIIELKKYYEEIFDKYSINLFLEPSIYLLIKNFTIILDSLNKSKIYLDKWYDVVKLKKRKRVVLNHNNLKLSNFIVSKNYYLINWYNSIIDYPIYDIYSLFINNYKTIDMIDIFLLYDSKYGLLEEEKYLFFSKLLRINKIEILNNYLINTKNVYDNILYLKKVNEFLNNYMKSKK